MLPSRERAANTLNSLGGRWTLSAVGDAEEVCKRDQASKGEKGEQPNN